MSVVGQIQKSGHATGQSALPSRTDVASRACQVRKVPMTEVVFSLDHLVGDREKRRRDRGAERRSLERPHGLAPGLVRGFQRFTSQKSVLPHGVG